MNPQGEETIFSEVLRLPANERSGYLDQATSGRPELRRRVEALLGSYGSGDFLEQAAAPELRQTRDVTVALTEKPGETIGRYKLREQIGEGGCGVVYVAEQAQPVRRRVALKIIKLGMDTKSVIARFEAERQALALMDHPNIAKVFDAGATETGRPYFVMELVRGMKITEYCDEKKLSTRERLDLFIQVCQAIQHAHQKGIIHRDIKPSNILVTVNDGVPVPKVIDFGIAKATSGQQLTDKTIYTAFEQFIGTPAYMSPEQAVLTSLDIDTRSDIYALGVLLYELLTGKTPFDAKELLAIGLDEMRRTIREQEPQRPSTRLSTLAQNELSTTAQRRGLDAPKLVSELRGDLDWIVMKAMEKDRARRYETANGLAADVQRHLNNEPVVACPPSRIYRIQKAFRRNKLAFAAAGAVAASLVIGLTLSTVLFFRERTARKQANEQAIRADEQTAIAQAVNDFLQKDLLQQATSLFQADAHFTPDPNLTVREALDRAAERIGNRFTNQPLQEAAVRHAIGRALTGVNEYERALAQFQRAWDTRRMRLGPDHPDTLKSMLGVAIAYGTSGRMDRALPLFDEVVKRSQAALGPDHRETLRARQCLAEAYFALGRFEEGVTLDIEALALQKVRLGLNDADTLRTMAHLAFAHIKTGKVNLALPLSKEALQRAESALGPDHPVTFKAMNALASCYLERGQFDQAVALYDANLKVQQARLGPDDPATLWSMHNLAVTYGRAGKSDRILPLAEQTLKLRQAKLGPDHPDTLASMTVLMAAYLDADRLDKALPLSEDTFKLRKTKLGPDHPETLNSMLDLSIVYRRIGKLDQALSLLEERLELQKARLGTNHQDTLGSLHNLAIVYVNAGKFDQGLELLKKFLEVRQASDGPYRFNAMNDLAWAYERARDFDQAISAREEVLALQKDKRGPNHSETLRAKFRLGQTLLEAAEFHADDSRRREDLANWGDRLLREYLAELHGHYTNNPAKLADRVYDVADLRYCRANYAEAEPLYRELVELRRAALGAENKDTLDATASLARLLSDWAWAERKSKSEARNPDSEIVERAVEAERLLRDVLAARLRENTNSWRVGDVKSRLGGALVCVAVTDPTLDAQICEAKFSEAESLLLDGYDWLQNRSNDPKYKRDARRRIDRLYKVWNKPARRTEWQQKQLASLRKAAEKGNVGALNDLAWLLATCGDAGIRDGRNAVMFAEKAVAVTKRKDPTTLDTLAAAYAEVGEFAKAVNVQTEALTLLLDEKEKKGYESRLTLYQSNTPCREP